MKTFTPIQANATRRTPRKRHRQSHRPRQKIQAQFQPGRPYTTHVAWTIIKNLCLSATADNLDDVLARIAEVVVRAHAEIKAPYYTEARIGRAEIKQVGRQVAYVPEVALDLSCDADCEEIGPKLLQNIGWRLPGAPAVAPLMVFDQRGEEDC